MVKVVHIGDCCMIHDDCERHLKNAMEKWQVDVTITSPPYNTLQQTKKGSGMHKNNRWVKRAAEGYNTVSDDLPEDEYQAWLRRVVALCMDVSKGLVWINHKVRYREGEAVHPARFLPFPIYSEIIWDRCGSMTFNSRRFAPSHEMILGFGTPHWWDDSVNKLLSVWKISQFDDGRSNYDHPCPYPIKIPHRLIMASCPPGGTVFDPFAGTGTTGVACLRTGRKFIGCEKDEKFFEMACDRLHAAAARLGVVTGHKARSPKVGLFK